MLRFLRLSRPQELPAPGSAAGAGASYAFRAEVKIASGNGGLYLDARDGDDAAQATGLQVDLDARTGVGLYETGGRGWLWRSAEVKTASPEQRDTTSLQRLVEKAIKSWKPGNGTG